ncbi:MAG: hypothetical protein K9M15_00095 [Candidatus Marinimicrobia bacterium]|nr:hypothetical protein [Candidatus Neomarinimicrobiota bacterium]
MSFWKKPCVALSTLSAGAIFLFWPIISGRLLFTPKFIGFYHYIYFSAMKNFICNLGTLPNWWPAYNSGYPINLTLDAFLNPIFLLALKFLPAFFANNLMIFIFFILNGMALYWFARSIKLSHTASLISAISYAFSGVVLRHTGTTGIVAVMPFLPLAFLCCLKIMQGKKKWFWGWLALLTYSWIGGWSETIVYALTAVGFFIIYLLLKNKNYKRLILFFGAIVLSMLILSPWFLSVTNFISFTTRSGGSEVSTAGYMPTTLSHLVHMFHPRLSVFYGELLPIIPLGEYDYFLYFGTLPLLLVLISLFIKKKKEKGFLAFFLALAGGSILMTVNHSPLFWLFHQIPVLKWFGGYWKWSFVIVFSLAILAGYGFDYIKDFFSRKNSKKIIKIVWALFALSIIISGVIGILDQKIAGKITTYGTNNYQNTEDRSLPQTDEYYKNIIEKMSRDLVNGFSIKNKWLLTMFILWRLALAVVTAKKYDLMGEGKWKISVIAIALLGSTIPWYGLPNGPPVSFLKELPETAKYIHSKEHYSSTSLPLLKKDSETQIPFRIFIYLPDRYKAELSAKYNIKLTEEKNMIAFQREIMDDNLHKIFDFDTFKNHQTLTPARVRDVYFVARGQDMFTNESYKDTTLFSEYIDNFSTEKNLKLLGMLNIKYILSPFKLSNNLEPVFVSYTTEKQIPIYVYENPYFMPRWYFADEIKWAEPKNEIALETLKTINDFSTTTMLETINLNDPAIKYKASPNDTIELEVYTAGKLRLKTSTENYRFVVFSESRFPFWQSFVNGKEVPLYTANYLYQAVLVPPGENIIEFHYPKLWEQGVVSGQTLLNNFLDKLKPQLSN